MKSNYCAPLIKILFLSSIAINGSAAAVPLPKGSCEDPKPYTDLRHCHFEKVDLSNKDLRGVDLRVGSLYQTDFSGADLTGALFDRNRLLLADLDRTKGLPRDVLDTLSVYGILNDNNYLVIQNNNSTITLSPHDSVQGIQANIAGLPNIQMISKVANRKQTIAVLDWPRGGEGRMKTIVARFDNDKFDLPACAQSVDLLSDDRYYYPSWGSMKVRPLTDGSYLIGVTAGGSDADGEGVGGWDMFSFLKLSPTCGISVLHKEDTGWAEGPEAEKCQAPQLDIRFLDDQSAEVKITSHTCRIPARTKAKVSYIKIKLN